MNQDINKELRELSGEENILRHKFSVPTLKFHGLKNEFSILEIKDGKLQATPISAPFDFIILKVRRILKSYQEDSRGESIRIFTNEHNAWNDKLSVLEAKNGEITLLAEGNLKDVREQFPDLSLSHVLYGLLNNQIVKFPVKGKSLSKLFEYYQTFDRKKDEHVYSFITNVSSDKETNKGGLTFYVLTFKRGSAIDPEQIIEPMREISNGLKSSDETFRPSSFEDSRLSIPASDIEELPTIDIEEEDQAKTDKIPF